MFYIKTEIKVGNATDYIQIYKSSSLVACSKKRKEMIDMGLNNTWIEEKN